MKYLTKFFHKSTLRKALLVLMLAVPLFSAPVHAVDEVQEELFLVAQKAFEDGFHDVAIRYIEQFLQKFPQSEKQIQARLLLGQCYFFKSQYLKAFEIFQDLLSYSEFKDATLFWLGETYFKGSDYSQAEKYYRQLMNVYPESIYIPQAYYSLGWTFFEQNDYKQAKQLFLQMIKKFPAHQLSEDAAFKVGECEHNLGSYEIATQYFKNYILKYPQSTRHAEAYFYIAEAYYYLENFLTAITYYAKAADIAYNHNVTYMAKVSMGWCYLKLEKYDLSRRYFDQAYGLAEQKGILTDDIYLGQASLHSQMQNNEKALAAYTQLIEKFPNSPRIAEAHLGKANIHYTLKDYPQAIAEYQWLIDAYADNPQRQDILEKSYYGLAWTYLKSGDIDQSIRNFESIMNKTESKIVKVSALTQIGDAYQDSDELEKAVQIYDRILKDYPDSLYTDYVQFRLAIALLKQDKLEAATLSFQSLQANFPKSKYLNDVKYYLGVAYFKKEDWAQAIAQIQAYLDDPAASRTFRSEAHYILAQSHFNMENYEKSLSVFRELIQSYPTQESAVRISKLNVAKCLHQLGQEEEALNDFQAIIDMHPRTDAAHDAVFWLGNHYLEKGAFEESIVFYQQLLANFPGSDKIFIVHFELGQAYEALGRFDEALNHYKLIKESADKAVYAKAKLAIADIFSKEMDPQTAIDTYHNIATSAPEFKRDAFVKIAGIHEKNLEYNAAISAYRKALKAKQALSELNDAELQFYIGDTYEILNDSQKAVESYLKIPYLYSHETIWIIKAYLRIARIFEDDEKWEEAKTTYSKIIDYETEESKYAQERIDWMKENILH